MHAEVEALEGVGEDFTDFADQSHAAFDLDPAQLEHTT